MNPGGLALVLITVALIIIMITCNKYIRKITNCYFFWLIVAGFCFAWLLSFRFIPEWIQYIKDAPSFEDPSEYNTSVSISRAYLLDVCPFFALSILVALILDPTRKIARAIAPVSLIGGAITVTSMSFDQNILIEFSAKFIFFGYDPNSCYFIMHFIQVIMAIAVLLNTPSGGWKNWLATLIITILFYSYVAITMSATGCRWNCSGLSINDWQPEGEYGQVASIFGFSPKVCQIIGIPILTLVGCGIITLKDYVFNKGHWLYGNAFSGKWYSWYNYNKFTNQRFL